MQVSGELPISSHYGEHPSLHNRVHPYPASDPSKNVAYNNLIF